MKRAGDSKTEIKLLRSDEVWQPKLGAPYRNRRAWKRGMHSMEMRKFRSRLHALRVKVDAVLRRLEEERAARNETEG